MKLPGIADDLEPSAAQRAVIAASQRALRGLVRSPLARVVGAGPLRRPGSRLAPDVAAAVALDAIVEAKPADDPRKARLDFNLVIRQADELPSARVETRDLELAGSRGTGHVRLYRPAGAPAAAPILVYLHGGGWVIGSVPTHDALCRRLAATVGCVVASVRYRLAPESPFPAAVEDALAATVAVAEHAEDLGADPARLVVGGDSAGGNLAAVVAAKLRGEPQEPCLQVLIYPGVDATQSFPPIRTYATGYILEKTRIDWFLDMYAGDTDRTHPDMSPYFRDDVSGLCPALVYTAGHDPLRDEGEAYAEKLRAAGVDVTYRCFDDQVHGFANMSVIPSAHGALMRVVADLEARLSSLAEG